MGKIIRQSGDIRREQIKASVKEIIFFEGMQKLTTKNIAKKVGISEGTVFKHFTSKKAIINDILKDVYEEMVLPLQQIANTNRDPNTRLEKYICFHLEYLAKNKGITMLLFSEASYHNDADLKKMLNETYQLLEQGFAKIVQDGISEEIWDQAISVEDIASLYMGIPLAMNVELLLQHEKFKEISYCNNMLVLLQRILRK